MKIGQLGVIITDQEEAGKKLADSSGAHLLMVPPGEASKSRAMKAKLEDQMLELGLGRDCTVIALGGGMICDLAGFVAATYCRGVKLIFIPTSLLAMIDASIGGKVAINTTQGKNLIGTFYTPESILVDCSYLDTLPEKEWKNGTAEMIKYACIASKRLFKKLQQKKIHDCIYPCIAIKGKIVTKDPQEKGVRQILNFGHTIGHALEHLYRLDHGHAVALGILFEAKISHKLGYLSLKNLQKINALIESFEFKKIHTFDPQLLEIMKRDKKCLQGKPRFVLLKGIGRPIYGKFVEPDLIWEVLNDRSPL